jgi:hypothetical protein
MMRCGNQIRAGRENRLCRLAVKLRMAGRRHRFDEAIADEHVNERAAVVRDRRNECSGFRFGQRRCDGRRGEPREPPSIGRRELASEYCAALEHGSCDRRHTCKMLVENRGKAIRQSGWTLRVAESQDFLDEKRIALRQAIHLCRARCVPTVAAEPIGDVAGFERRERQDFSLPRDFREKGSDLSASARFGVTIRSDDDDRYSSQAAYEQRKHEQRGDIGRVEIVEQNGERPPARGVDDFSDDEVERSKPRVARRLSGLGRKERIRFFS